jgi:hypothetical protein
MYSQAILWDIMRFEMAMGPSHECRDCGSTFLANSDRCSNCGSYNIHLLNPLPEREPWDMETFPVHVWDKEEGEFMLVKEGDYSQYPRIMEGANG